MAGYARAYSARSVLKRVSVFSFSFRAGYAQEEPYTLRVGRIRSEFAQGERIQQGAGYAQVLFLKCFFVFGVVVFGFCKRHHEISSWSERGAGFGRQGGHQVATNLTE